MSISHLNQQLSELCHWRPKKGVRNVPLLINSYLARGLQNWDQLFDKDIQKIIMKIYDSVYIIGGCE